MKLFYVDNPLREWKAGDYPVIAHVNIGLAVFSQNPQGRIILTENLMRDEEVDEAVSRIKAQLDDIAREAKATIKKTNERILKSTKEGKEGTEHA